MRDFADQATYIGGVMRWKSNNNIPPSDIVEQALEAGMPVDVETTNITREVEQEEWLEQYRAQQPSAPSDEERYEARAAHGEGVVLVDVFSGRKFTT